MNNEIIKYNLDNLENYSVIKEDVNIINNNIFFNKLSEIMNKDNIFRNFYDKYFKNFSDIKTVIMYMKLYETIEKEYFQRYNVEIKKELLIYFIVNLMKDEEASKNIIKAFTNYTEDNIKNKYYILDIFENNLKNINYNEEI